jgi:predicted phage terminase large subunit-like protein
VSADTAMKDGQRNDFTAIGVWIEDFFQNHYLAHVTRDKLEFNDMVKAVENIATVWGATAILMEDKGSGTQFIQTRSDKAPCPVIAISTNNNSKEFRLDGVSPMFEGGKVWIPEASEGGWHPDYESELLGFPNAKYDDQVDMTSQYLTWAREKKAHGNKKLEGKSKSKSTSTDAVRASIEEHIAQRTQEVLKTDPIARALAKARGVELPDLDED